jgi:hypothetical protein
MDSPEIKREDSNENITERGEDKGEDKGEESSTSNSPEIQMEQIFQWDISEKSLEQVLKKVKPLDLFLFSGSSIVSKTIRMMERGKFGQGKVSHVAVVVNREIMPHVKELERGKYYLWESTSSSYIKGKKIKNIFGKTKFGVQIRDLQQVVDGYDGNIYWAKLSKNPWKYKYPSDSLRSYGQRKRQIISKMEALDQCYGKSKFNIDVIDLASAIFPSIRPIRKIKKKLGSIFKRNKKHFVPLFCSEFVAIIYQKLEILPDHIEPSDVTPVDFLGINQNGIPLLLKKIVEIK